MTKQSSRDTAEQSVQTAEARANNMAATISLAVLSNDAEPAGTPFVDAEQSILDALQAMADSSEPRSHLAHPVFDTVLSQASGPERKAMAYGLLDMARVGMDNALEGTLMVEHLAGLKILGIAHANKLVDTDALPQANTPEFQAELMARRKKLARYGIGLLAGTNGQFSAHFSTFFPFALTALGLVHDNEEDFAEIKELVLSVAVNVDKLVQVAHKAMRAGTIAVATNFTPDPKNFDVVERHLTKDYIEEEGEDEIECGCPSCVARRSDPKPTVH